jgi:hypothetical protein
MDFRVSFGGTVAWAFVAAVNAALTAHVLSMHKPAWPFVGLTVFSALVSVIYACYGVALAITRR